MSALEEQEEPPVWVFGKLGVEYFFDKIEVAVVWLPGVEGEEEVVAEQDDAGEKVTDTVLIVVTLHQLGHPNGLQVILIIFIAQWSKGGGGR